MTSCSVGADCIRPCNKHGGAPRFRYAPSPTGYTHLGNIGAALCGRMLANSHNGIFFLRIEDTDQKREVAGADKLLIKDLNSFGITFDEGPYYQSQRKEIYAKYAQILIDKGHAYKCYCEPGKKKDGFEGYQGDCLKLTNPPTDKPYAIRFNPVGATTGCLRVEWTDLVKGSMSLPTIKNHPIIIKQNGLPPYNFAHVVDDFEMKTSHVVRGEEWLASTAEHIQLCIALHGSVPWSYAHMPTICIQDGKTKRKLSKRKDKFFFVSAFLEEGYPKQAVVEYLLTLYNSNFEIWRAENPNLPYTDFKFTFEKVGNNNKMFDVQKLDSISREIIARMSADELKQHGVDDKVITLMQGRKDIAKFSEIKMEYSYLFEKPNLRELEKYNFRPTDTREEWLAKVKEVGPLKEEMPKIRKILTGREHSPDLYTIYKLLAV